MAGALPAELRYEDSGAGALRLIGIYDFVVVVVVVFGAPLSNVVVVFVILKVVLIDPDWGGGTQVSNSPNRIAYYNVDWAKIGLDCWPPLKFPAG